MPEFFLEILRGKDGLLSSRRLIAIYLFGLFPPLVVWVLYWLMLLGHYKQVTAIVLAIITLLGGSGYFIAKERFKK